MNLSDSISVGDQVMHTPSWEHDEHGAPAPAQPAKVIYVHPDGRYYTIKYNNGLTDTVQTVPPERVTRKETKPTGYGMRTVPTRRSYQSEGKSNKYVRDKLKSLHVSQTQLSRYMGYSKGWMNYKPSCTLSKADQEAIIRAAEKVAAERSET